jgi:hypothetical protein
MLPTSPTPPKQNLSDYSILLYGPSKSGKTTTASQADGVLFLATEPGLNALTAYQQPITSWEDLLAACAEIAAGNHPFKTIVIDTVDLAYRFCSEHMLKKYSVEHESDLNYGKGYALVNNEFHRVLTKLAHLPYGFVLISHAQEIEIETRTGKYTKTVPTLPDKARKIVLGLVDIILFCDIEVSRDANNQPIVRRVIRTKPTQTYEAGDRTGRLPEVIEMDYRAFVDAFNAATAATIPDTKQSGPPATPAPAKTSTSTSTAKNAGAAPAGK